MAKFKALAELGGSVVEEAIEGVEAGQEGYGIMVRKLELLYGGKDRQMVARVVAIKECKVVHAGDLKDMQALVDAVTKYQASLPPEWAQEGRSVQHAVEVVHKLSEELQLLFRQYCTQIGVEDEYNVPLLMCWLRDHHLRHLYKRKDAAKAFGTKKAGSGGSGAGTGGGSAGAAATAAGKHKAVFLVGNQQMELVPVTQDGTGGPPPTQQARQACATAAPKQCWYCQDKHKLVACPDFRSKPAATRKALVHGADLCAICLQWEHFGADCSGSKCETCGSNHHALIH